MSSSPSHTVLFLCTSLEGGVMSSCLRNALKMRITEHFPNSPQFTFSAFSLGCQAFVVIFINSNRWLLPFLPRTVPPPAGSDVILQLTALQAGLAPVSPDNTYLCISLLPLQSPPSLSVGICNAILSVYNQAFDLSRLLLFSHSQSSPIWHPKLHCSAIVHLLGGISGLVPYHTWAQTS